MPAGNQGQQIFSNSYHSTNGWDAYFAQDTNALLPPPSPLNPASSEKKMEGEGSSLHGGTDAAPALER